MRVFTLACAAIALGQGALARDVALVLDWPDAAPAAEIVAVARDSAGAVLEVQRLPLPEGTQQAVLPLPSLSRQTSTVQVGALVAGAFALQSSRVAAEGGQPPERLRLSAALTASFSADYLCASGQVIALQAQEDGLRVGMGDSAQIYMPGDLDSRFIGPEGTALTRIPGLVQFDAADGTLLDSCRPIPSRPVLPLSALGRTTPSDTGWAVFTGLDGSVLSLPGQPPLPDDTPPPRVATSLGPIEADRLRLDIGDHALALAPGPCQLPGQSMPYPHTATLTGPGGPFAPGCAGDPLRALEGAAWQVSHLFGQPLPHSDSEAPALTFQVDTGRLSGRTSCNRYLGRAVVEGGILRISELGTTRLACGAALSNLETRFLDALEGARDIAQLKDGRVALYAGATAVLLLERRD
ncbi:META domain-containing protein [Roseibaca sp. Y0-43]|uniref:META domain-containing protein n=1 Tax=Roseibaca sp. Y0-43 TaxID=2816854 RepID=UPI001D0C5B64|nr:META domain-containing protein [Roseibaca sp. Y0-43]